MPEAVDSIGGIVVLYEKGIDSPTISSLAQAALQHGRVLDLIVQDNSPVRMIDDPGIAHPRLRVHYRHDMSNPGVSRAYNSGADIARQMGKKWLLLLDQDTVLPKNALEVYASVAAENPDVSMFVPKLYSGRKLLSPCGFVAGIGYHLKSVKPGPLTLSGRGVLNSGMLVSLDAFDAAGGFREDIPLDFSDHDFCRRFARLFKSGYVLDIECQHGFSNLEDASFEKDMARFRFYCRGARNSIYSVADVVGHTVAVGLRTMVLCRRHGTSSFLSMMWHVYCRGNSRN